MIDHLDDLESDFSRFHRIDDIYELDGPKFMRLAWRISVYGGVMGMRVQVQNSKLTSSMDPRPSSSPTGNGHRTTKADDVTWVSPATFTMMHGTGGG